MKITTTIKLIVLFGVLLVSNAMYSQDTYTYATALILNNSGVAKSYNTTAWGTPDITPYTAAQNSVNTTDLTIYNNISLGTFTAGSGSSYLKLDGAEVRTFKQNLGSNCAAQLQYSLSENSTPATIIANGPMALPNSSTCVAGPNFPDGVGPCVDSGYEKWRVNNAGVNLTSREGKFTLTFYYEVQGDDFGGCVTWNPIDNGFSVTYTVNPTLNFNAADPLAVVTPLSCGAAGSILLTTVGIPDGTYSTYFTCDNGKGGSKALPNVVVSNNVATIPAVAGIYKNIKYRGLSGNNVFVTGGGSIEVHDPNPPTTPTIVLVHQPDCATATGSIDFSGLPTSGTGSWQIYATTAGVTSLVLSNAVAGTSTATVTGLLATKTYDFTVKNSAGCISSPTGTTTFGTQPLSPSVANQTSTICSAGTFTVTPVNNGTTIILTPSGSTYSWGLPVVTGGVTGGATGAAQASISGTLVNPTAVNQTATYTVTPQSLGTGHCDGPTFTVTVTVQPTTAISAQSTATQTQCLGGTFTPISVTANGTGALSYQWYSNAANSNAGGVSLGASNGAQTSSYTPQAGVAGTLYYYCVVTSTCGTATSAVSGAFVTQSTVTAGSIGTDQTICNGSTPAALTSTGAGLGAGAISYEWQTDASGSYVTIAGQVAATYAPPALTATTHYQRRSVSTLNGNICYSAYTAPVTITVQTTPGAGSIGTDQTICNGSTPAALTSTGVGTGSGAISYEWQTDASGSFVTIGGQVAATYAPPSLTSTTSYQRRTVSTQNGVVCYSVYTTPVVITVQATPTAGTIATAQTICNGATPAALTSTTAGTGSGVITYEWQTNASGGYLDIPAANAATYAPPALTSTTSYKRRTVSTLNGTPCYSAYTAPITITVQTAVTAGTIGTAQTICNGSTPAGLTSTAAGTGSGVITYEWQTDASGSFADIPAANAATYAPPALTATTNYQRRTVSTLGGVVCYSAYTPAITITVQSTPTAGTIAAAQTICNGATPTALSSTVDGTGSGVITYEWQTDASGSYVTIAGQSAATYAPPALTSTTNYRRRTVSTQNGVPCYSVYTAAITITVQSTLTAGTIGTAQTICNGSTPSGLTSTAAGTGSGVITYEWQTNASGSFVTIPAANAATYAPPALTTTTSYQRRTVSTQNGAICYSGYTAPVVITVQSLVTAGTIGADQTICNGTTPASLTSTLDGTGSGVITYEWMSDDGTGYVPVVGASSSTYSPGSLVITMAYKRRTVSTTAGVSCYSAYTTPVTITVQTAVTPGTIAGTETICNGSTPVGLSSSVDGTGSGALSYEWQSNSGGGFSTIAGANSSTYNPGALFVTTVFQRRTVSLSGGVTCNSAYSNQITITVNAAVVAGTIGTAQVICNGSTPAALTSTADGSGSGAISYQWQADDHSGAGFVTIGGATAAAYAPGVLITSTDYRRRTKSVSGGVTCFSAYTPSISITVNAAVTAGSIGSNQVICNGSTPSSLTSSTDGTGSGLISYEWQTNASGSYVTIGGQTASTYAPPALVATTSYQRRTVSLSGGTTCYSAYTTPVVITVNNTVTAGSIGSNQTICNGDIPASLTSVAGTGSGVISYEWQADAGAGYATIVGVTTPTYSPAALTVTTSYQRRTVSVSGGTTCYSAYTAPVTITVQSLVTAGTIASAQTICNGSTPSGLTSTVDGTGSGAISYEWQVDDGTGYVSVVGANANTYSPGALIVTTSYKRRTVSTTNGIACYSAYTTPITITVQATPTAGTIATAQTICNGSAPATLTSTVDGTGDGVITYEWQTNATGSYVTIAGQTASTYAPPALVATTSYQRRTVSVLNGVTCYSAYTAPIMITVNNVVTAGTISANQVICNGDIPAGLSSTLAGTGSGAISYQWQYDNGAGFTNLAGVTTANYSPGALLVTTSYQRRTKSVSGGTTCYSAYTSPVVITVNAAVTAGAIGTSQVICNGSTPASLSSTVDGTGAGVLSYEWQFDDGSGYAPLVGVSSSTYAPGALTVSTSYQRRTKSVSGGTTCYSPYTTAVDITVNNTVTAGSISADQTICNGSTPATLSSTAPGTGSGAISYEWQADAGLGYSTIGAATSATYSPPSLITTTTYKRRTVSFSGGVTCYSNYTTPVTITVQAAVVAGTIGTAQTICNGDVPAGLTSTIDGSGSGVISYEWQADDGTGYVTIGGANASTYSPGALTVSTSYKRRTVSLTNGINCYSAYTPAISITVNNLVTAGSIGTAQTICNGSAPNTLTSTLAGSGLGAISYEWQEDAGAGFVTIAGANADTYSPGALLVNTSYQRRTVSVSGGVTCYSVYTAPIAITVNAVATAGSISGNQVICSGSTPASITNSSLGTGSGVVSYQWQADSGSGYVTIVGATLSSYSPGALLATTSYQRRTKTVNGGTTCYSAYTTPVTVTVNNAPTAGAIATDQTLCNGDVPTALTSTTDGTGSGVVTYEWQVDDGLGGGFVDIAGQVLSTYAPPALTATMVYQRRTKTVSGGVTCYSAYTSPVTITVNNVVTTGSIGGTENICYGSTPTGLTNLGAGTGSGTISYEWQYDDGSGYLTIAGATFSNYNPGALLLTTNYKRRTVSVSGGKTCYSNYTAPITITVNSVMNAGTIGSDQTICNGSTPATLTSTADGSGGGVISYVWQFSTGGAYTTIGGATSSTYSPGALLTTTTYRRRTKSINGITCFSNWTPIVTITVNNTAVAGTIAGTQTICNGATPAALTSSADGSGTGIVSYEWQADNGGGYATIGGATSSTYAPGPLAVTTSYQRRTVSNNGGVICNSPYTPAITITVTPNTAIGSQSTGTQTQCGLAAFTPISVTATGTGTITYQWYSNAAANTTTGTTLGAANGAQTNSYTPQSTSAGTLYYYCIVHSDCGPDVTSALSGAFIVLPLPNTGLTVGGGGGAGICSNTSTNITVAASVVGVNYQLRNDHANELIGGVVAGNGGSINLPTGILSTTTTFNVLAIDQITSCSAQLTQKQTVIVNNLPTISLNIDPVLNVCNNATPTTINLTYSAQSADTYYITYDAAAKAVGFSDVTETAMIPSPFIIPVPHVAGGQEGTYNAIFTVKHTADGCTQDYPFTVTINPAKPSDPGAITGNLTPCSGATEVYSISAVTNPGTYDWTYPADWTVAVTPGIQHSNSITLVVGTTSGPVSVQPSNACGASDHNSSISPVVSASPVVNPIIGAANVCNGATGSVYHATTNHPGNTYAWTVVGGTITSGAGTSSINVTWNVVGAGTVDMTETSGACSTVATQKAVTVSPIPTPVITGAASVCNGTTGSIYSTPNVGGNSYAWSVTGGTITSGNGSNSITVDWNVAGAGTVDVTETIIASGCSSASTQKAVTVLPLPNPVILGAAAVCNGTTGSVYSVTNVVGHTYSWTVVGGNITAGTGTNSITVTWNVAGTGTVDVIETITATGCVKSATQKSVTVNALPNPVIVGATDVCDGTTGSVYTVTNTGGHTYAWSVSGGIVTAGAGTNSITVTWNVPGSGTVDLTETITATGCSTAAAQMAVNINALPNPSITGNDNECVGTTASTYFVNNVAGHSYSWSVVGGTITAGQNTNSIQITWNTVGAATVDVTETITLTGCSKAATQKAVTILALPTPAITGAATACANETGVVYSTPLVAGHTYSWSVVGGVVTAGANTRSITVTWGAAGAGTVDLVETITATGCANSATQKAVTINALPTPVIAGANSACENEVGDVFSTTNVVGNTYSWNVVGGVVTAGAGTNSITVTWGSAGVGTIDLTETITATGCLKAATQKSLTINPLPTPMITGNSVACANEAGVVYSTPNVGGHTYNWNVVGGVVTAGAATNSITVSWGAAGAGSVDLTEIITATGCSNAASQKSVSINPLPTPVITGNSVACANETGSIYSVTNVAGHIYNWSVVGGVITAGTGSHTITVTWGVAGAGTVDLTETIVATGCSKAATQKAVTINPLPTPVIAGAITVCAAETGSVYSTTNFVGHTYNWNVVGGAITAGAGTNSITVTWGAAGTGTVDLTETITASACSTIATQKSVTIKASPSPVITGNASACANETGVVYSSPLVAGHTYAWTVLGGVVTAGAATHSITVSWGVAGAGTVDLIETLTANGCSTNATQKAVTINALPTPVITGSATACATETGSVYSTPSVAGHVYNWSVVGGVVTAGTGTNSITVTWGAAGAGTVDLTETITATGCATIATQKAVSINAMPTPSITGAATACANESGSVYSAINVVGHTYNWSVAGGVISAGAGTNSITVTWGAAGPGTVDLIETITASGCFKSATQKSVTINALPSPVIVGANSACAPQVGVVYTTTNVIGHTYSWNVVGGVITAGAGTNSITVTWNAAGAGTVDVTETITATGCSKAATQLGVTVNSLPTPVITGSANACANETGSVYSTPNVVGNTYNWNVVGGVVTAGAGTNSITVTWGSAGVGTIDLTETITATGCLKAATQKSLTINPLPTPVITGNSVACANEVGVIYSTPNVVGHTYSWSVVGGAITAGTGTNSITVTWGAAGAGTVDLTETITATACSKAATQKSITINALPSPAITGSATVCANEAGDIYSTPNVVGHTYSWSVVGGAITAGAGTNSITVTWGAAGAGTVDLTETITATACSKAATQLAVSISALPTPVIVGSATACATETGAIYSVTNVVGHTYSWNVVGGVITAGANTNSISITWGGVGAGTVDLTETITATGCLKAATQKAVTINPIAPVTPGIITGTLIQCPANTGQIYSIAAVTNATTYTWTVPTGWSITAGQGTRSITVTAGVGGDNGNISVTAGNSCGTSAAQSLAVQVLGLPATPGVITGTVTNCPAIVQVYSITAVAGATTYNWSVPAGWSITSGAGTTSISVTTGTAGQNGNISVAAGNACGNSAAQTLAVTVSAPPTAPTVGTITQPFCNVATGSVVLNGLPAGLWTLNRLPDNVATASSGNSITVTGLLPSTTYTFTVTNAMGCTSAASANVVISANSTAPSVPTVSGLTQPTCNVPTGSVTLGGLPAGNWTINPGAITGSGNSKTLTGLLPATYSYSVTNAAGCTSLTVDVVINANINTPPAPSVDLVTQPSGAVLTGSVDLSGLPATGTWSLNRLPDHVSFTGSGTTTTVSGLVAGTYNFVVTNAAGCVSLNSTDVVINPPAPVAVGAITGLSVQCPAATAQVYSVVAVANATTYTWAVPANWSITSGQGTNSIQVTTGPTGANGNITVTAGNINGNSAPQILAVQVFGIPAIPTTITGTANDCPASSEVYSVASVAGATTYNWTVPTGWTISNGNGTSSITVSTGNAGQNGNVTVSAGNNCGFSTPQTLAVTVFTPPAAPVVGALSQPNCNVATGGVLLTGLPASNWVLTRFPGNVAIPGSGTTYTVTGLNPGATYNFMVSNSNSCVSSLSADVVINANASSPSAPMISSITQPSCGISTGRVVLSGLPAVGTWTLTRTPGAVISTGLGTTKTITNLAPGTYTYIVADASGCVSLSSENIVIDPQPQLPATPILIKGGTTQCAGVTEIYSVDKVTDATTYTWTVPAGWTISSGQGTDSITVITGAAGQTANVTVTANSVCGASAPQTLSVQISTPPSTPTVGAKVQPSCPIPTGSVTLNNLPAVGTWTLTRTPDGLTKTGNGSSVLLTGLVPNTYTYTVTNAAGCVSAPTGNIVITANPSTPAKPTLGLITQPSCGVATGKVVLTGLPAGTWTLNPGGITGASSSTTIANLTAGNYNFSVTDINGCLSLPSDTVKILPQPFTPAIPGVITGSVSNCAADVEVYTIADVVNATTYNWTVPTGWTINSGQGTTSLTVKTGAAGQNGNITVTAANACGTSAASVQSVSVSLAPSAPTVGLRTQPTCANPTGAVVLNGLPAGDWEINPGAIKGLTTMYKIYDLVPGTYNFTVTNSAGCTSPASASVIINANASAPATPSFGVVTQPTCAVPTGSVNLTGLPAGIWTINPGAIVGNGSTKTISGLLPGKYSFTVTNASNCTSLTADTVIVPNVNTPTTPLVGTILQPTCTVFTGSVVLSDLPTGNWTLTRLPDGKVMNGTGTTSTITELDPGIYNFRVVNSMGCLSLISDDVVINAIPVTPSTPIIQSVIQPTCAATVGTVNLAGLPATGAWTLTRLPDGKVTTGLNSTTATITDLSPGTYSFMVTNSVGCNSVPTANVVLNAATLPTAPTASFVQQPTRSSATGTISFTVQNGVEYSINGTDFQTMAIFTGVNPGTYTLTVRKATDHTCTADGLTKVTLSSVGPKANNDFVKVNENDSIIISVLANDDFGQDPPKATSIVATNGLHGTVMVLDNGTPNNQKDDKLRYIPEAYYDGPDSFTYTICSENGMCSTATVDVTVADIDQLVQVTKKVTKPELRKDGTYWLTYSIVAKNKTSNIISQMQIVDDLSKTFLAPVTYKVISATSSSRLHPNTQYDGAYDLNTLVGDGQLLGNQSDSVIIVVQIDPNGYTGAVYNQALMSGVSADGPMYNIRSDDGSMQLEPKKTESALSAIKLVAPAAFTPNGDGLNDKYVILHSSILRVKFQVFNRWGSVVYKSDDYQNDWEGKGIGMYANQDLPNGTYYFVIEMVNPQTGEVVQKNGYLSLKR